MYLQRPHAEGYAVTGGSQAVFPYRGEWAGVTMPTTPTASEWRALIHTIRTAPTA